MPGKGGEPAVSGGGGGGGGGGGKGGEPSFQPSSPSRLERHPSRGETWL